MVLGNVKIHYNLTIRRLRTIVSNYFLESGDFFKTFAQEQTFKDNLPFEYVQSKHQELHAFISKSRV